MSLAVMDDGGAGLLDFDGLREQLLHRVLLCGRGVELRISSSSSLYDSRLYCSVSDAVTHRPMDLVGIDPNLTSGSAEARASRMRCPRFVLAAWMLSLAGGCGAAPAATSQSPSVTSTATPSAPSAPPPSAGSAHPSLKAPGEATIGDRTTCPTSGEEFVVSGDSPKYEYRGKTYYFCCSGCDATFAKDPEKFLKKKPDT